MTVGAEVEQEVPTENGIARDRVGAVGEFSLCCGGEEGWSDVVAVSGDLNMNAGVRSDSVQRADSVEEKEGEGELTGEFGESFGIVARRSTYSDALCPDSRVWRWRPYRV